MTADQRSQRAIIESRRGITRDTDGKILLDADALVLRIEALLVKRLDFEQRIRNIDEMLPDLRNRLASFGLRSPALEQFVRDRTVDAAVIPEAHAVPIDPQPATGPETKQGWTKRFRM